LKAYNFKALIFLITLSLSIPVHSVRIIYYYEFPPFCFIQGKEIRGLYVDIVRAAFKKMNVPIEEVFYPFKRALSMSYRGDGIGVGFYNTEQRSKKLNFSAPFFLDKLAFFTKKKDKFNYRKLDDLKGKIVGFKLGWSYGKDFDRAKQGGFI